ncbi:MAG: efflux RND transporter permease subunit [Candidatus Hydrogenedentes bacterium]|nr:efflux RND transporter permease subunit [Candidatus Hydrogenedentota bacterium]
MRSLITAFARNRVFSNIVLAFVFFGGYLALINLPRETFPDMHLDVIHVTVVWPGADPEEVEEGICRKIEDAVDGLVGIERYNTVSNENYGFAIIEVEEGQDLSIVKDRVRNAVDAITTLPPDAERPVVEEYTLRVQVLFLALTGENATERDLKEYAEEVKRDLRTIPALSQVEVIGTRDYEISIEVSEERLRQYGITFDQVAQAVRANSLNLPGGLMRTRGEEIRLRTMGRNYTGAEFASIIVLARPNGDNITLDRIATIRDGFVEDQVLSRFNGLPAVTVSIRKTEDEDTLAIDRAVHEYVERKRADLPAGIHLQIWGRMSTVLEARISLLVRNGLQGLTLVFILLWLFLDIRLSFWVSLGMPVSIMGAFMVMWYADATINMITLFGMVAVLGIIVDDATVVGEAIYYARKRGASSLRAAVDGVMEVGSPIFAAVVTNMVAFVPLAFVSGFMGQIVKPLPLVVIAAFTVSLLECMLLFPAHMSKLPNPNLKPEGRHFLIRLGLRFHRITNESLEWFAERVYQPVVTLAIHYRYVSLSVAVMVLLISWGLVDTGVVKFVMFPEIDGNALSASVEFPNGTPVETTAAAVERMEQAIREVAGQRATASGEPLISNMFSLAGARINDVGGSDKGSHLGTVRVELLDSALRGIHTQELMAAWERQIGPLPGVLALTFRGDELRPPGRPIEIWIQGDNIDRLAAAADELKAKLATYDGVYQIQDDFRAGKDEIRLRLKPEARALGITVADLARQIYTGYFGQEAVRVQRGRDDVRVRVRYPVDERRRFSELEKLRIRTSGAPGASLPPAMGAGGASSLAALLGAGGAGAGGPSMMQPGAQSLGRVYEVPLFSVADIEFTSGYAAINRTDGQRRIKVTTEIDNARANATELVAELSREFLPQMQGKYRDLTMSFQGEQQDLRESLDSLLYGFPLAVVAVFVVIATILRSYLQPFVIMFTVPFGIIGAVFGHLALGFDLSIMSVFGLVALAGVVVNDAIVLVDCLNTKLAQGESFADALRRAGTRRFRAIFLTTITTVGGLFPIIMERDYQAQIVIPMAIALAAGVAFSTLLTLLLLPSILSILNDLRRVAAWAARGVMPAAEDVEPARWRNAEEQPVPPTADAPDGNTV